MMTEKGPKTDFIHDFKMARAVLRCLNFKLSNFIFPLGIAFISTFFDAASKLLLIPVLKGIMTRDYGFVIKIPIIGSLSSNILQTIPLDQHNIALFVILMAFVLMTFTLQYIFLYWALMISTAQMRFLSSQMQKAVFNRHLTFGKIFYDRVGSEINNVILQFPEFIFEKIHKFNFTMVNMFRFTVYLVILCVLSWKLTILAAIVFPSLFFLGRLLNRKIRVISKEIVVVLREFSKQAADAIANITLVKLYQQENQESERFSRFSNKVALHLSIDKKRESSGTAPRIFDVSVYPYFCNVHDTCDYAP